MRSPRQRRTRHLVAAGVIGALAALTSCASPPPQPRPVDASEPVPVVTDTQLDRVSEQVAEVMTAADRANDPKVLAARVDGAALQLRQTQYAIRRKIPQHPAPAPLGTERLVDVVPADQEWPRFAMTVTEAAPDAVPTLSVLTQAGPRAPYKLTASATLLPGVTLPRTAPAEVGVETLPPTEDSGLAMPPAEALARYSSVLAQGAASPDAATFPEDPFRKTVVAEQDAERKAAGVTCKKCFSYAVTHTPRDGALWSVRTEDGGALVMGVLDSTRAFGVATKGAKLPIPADLAALAGRTVATRTATISSVEVVALHVPPAGGESPQVTVLAANRGPVSVAAR